MLHICCTPHKFYIQMLHVCYTEQVALGVADVERAIAAAFRRHEECSHTAIGDSSSPIQREAQLQMWHESDAQAEFYLTVGQHVYILPPPDDASDSTTEPTAAVVVAAPRDKLGVWLVRIGNGTDAS